MLEACKELVDIFPEDNMSELDASDFKDRANRIWSAVRVAFKAIANAESEEL